MYSRLKVWIGSSKDSDPNEAQVTGLLRLLLLTMFAVGILYSTEMLIYGYSGIMAPALVGGIAVLAVAMFALLKRGNVRVVCVITVAGVALVMMIASYSDGGIRSPAYPGLLVLMLVAGLLLGWRAALGVSGFAVVWGFALIVLHTRGELPNPPEQPTSTLWGVMSIYLLFGAGLLRISLRNTERAMEQARYELAERKRAEAALRAERDLLNGIMRTSVAAIVMLDPNGQIVFANDRAEHVLGLSQDSVAGRSYNAPAWHHTDLDGGPWPDENQPFRQVMRTGAPVFNIQHAIEWPNGDRKYLSVNGAPIKDANGIITTLVFSVSDITEQRLAEAQLRQAQKMEAVGRFAGGIAHDFNNILTVILGNCDLMLAELEPNSDLRHDVKQIQGVADRAVTMTRQLLAFSRRQVLRQNIFDLNTTVATAGALLQRLIGEDVVLEAQFSPDPSLVRADEGQLEQVILNLVVNARDAMPDGGQLAISTTHMLFDRPAPTAHGIAEPGDYVALIVADTGHGMDPSTQRQIFDPFFTTKPPGKGTGLGLATAHGIVSQFGGHIMVKSTPGEGSVFTILLPRVEDDLSDVPAPHMARRLARGSGRILLVEDETSLRELLERVLLAEGYAVWSAANGDEALLVANGRPAGFDLLLTDVVMPGALNGRRLADTLLARWPDLRLLYISGYHDENLILPPNGAAFLQKPFTPEALVVAVHDLLS